MVPENGAVEETTYMTFGARRPRVNLPERSGHEQIDGNFHPRPAPRRSGKDISRQNVTVPLSSQFPRPSYRSPVLRLSTKGPIRSLTSRCRTLISLSNLSDSDSNSSAVFLLLLLSADVLGFFRCGGSERRKRSFRVCVKERRFDVALTWNRQKAVWSD